MNPSDTPSNKGILHAEAGLQRFTLKRIEPSADLEPFIEHYWVVRWDLRDQTPFSQTILSYPNVNLSFEQENGKQFSGVYGVPQTTYTRNLRGEGRVLGIKFKPGGFYPFWQQPISMLTGRILSFEGAFGVSAQQLEQMMFTQEDDHRMADIAEDFLRKRHPEPDYNVKLINQMVQAAIAQRTITKVEDLASLFDMNKRTLQRLFNRYVGVSPKWVIQRFRLQDAAELMEQGGVPDWSGLSLDLGYYDQAHFIKTFKAIIGKSPEQYVKEIGLA
ncbi:AraC family transcriptional regulator [Paenibacillus aestuarii]|uniref:AraC family transcriptional regulator n=1 Tax=Paenibacillus aestuarii TaxID=516965 RepID=A0ABW0KAX0_9BACL|nr:AraC family transcriptional regulator [Paenibacillus aestuarii]